MTVALAVYRDFPWRKVGPYCAAQVVGGFLGGALTYLTYRPAFLKTDPDLSHTASVLCTFPAFPEVPMAGFFDQVIGTALLILFLFAVSDEENLAPGSNLIPVLTAYENIELPLLLLPMSRAERQKRVEIALQAVDLADRADHYPRQLSGGQEQRVGIARAIVMNPTLVVGDEPTGSLDAATGAQIQELLVRLNEELGMTILIVTHDATVASLATRRLRLDGGLLQELTGNAEAANGHKIAAAS